LPVEGVGGAGGRGRSLLPIVGKVTKVDGKTISMTASDGSTLVVSLADDPSLGRRKKAKLNDIAVGDAIAVRGSTGDDGVLVATAATVGDVEPAAIPGGVLGGVTAGGDPRAGTPIDQAVAGSAAALADSRSNPSAIPPATASESSIPTTTPGLGGLLPSG
jgi:hypothetical protein